MMFKFHNVNSLVDIVIEVLSEQALLLEVHDVHDSVLYMLEIVLDLVVFFVDQYV
jgi:hypothetical protein